MRSLVRAARPSAAAGCRRFSAVTVAGRQYQLPAPGEVVVGVCIDGNDPEYMDHPAHQAAMRHWSALKEQGRATMALGKCAMPSFTNPNNMSIVTGSPPAVHGITGNYYLDSVKGDEVMMTKPSFLRERTILQAAADADVSLVVVTTKIKLQAMLANGLDEAIKRGRAVALAVESVEKEDATAQLAGCGFAEARKFMAGELAPDIYDPNASIYCLQIGGRLALEMGRRRPDRGVLAYLSTTDYVQHKYAPGEARAVQFYQDMDTALAMMDQPHVRWGVTADHGMSSKTRADGSPHILFLQTEAERIVNEAAAAKGVPAPAVRAILPITDPYVAHHAALGGYATLYVEEPATWAPVIKAALEQRAGQEPFNVLTREEAAAKFQLPADRIGDIVVTGSESMVFGKSVAAHDLKQVPNLRSHGSEHEQAVHLWFNRPDVQLPENPRNFDLFSALLSPTA